MAEREPHFGESDSIQADSRTGFVSTHESYAIYLDYCKRICVKPLEFEAWFKVNDQIRPMSI